MAAMIVFLPDLMKDWVEARINKGGAGCSAFSCLVPGSLVCGARWRRPAG
jgi:hypothetical protein